MNFNVHEEKILSLLGMAAKSNSIVYGKVGIRNYISSPRIKQKLIIVPIDTGKRVKLDTFNKCKKFKVPFIEINKTKSEISKALGCESVSVIGITNEDIVKGILELVPEKEVINRCQGLGYTKLQKN